MVFIAAVGAGVKKRSGPKEGGDGDDDGEGDWNSGKEEGKEGPESGGGEFSMAMVVKCSTEGDDGGRYKITRNVVDKM